MIAVGRAIARGGCSGEPRSDVTLRALARERRIDGRVRGLAALPLPMVWRIRRR